MKHLLFVIFVTSVLSLCAQSFSPAVYKSNQKEQQVVDLKSTKVKFQMRIDTIEQTTWIKDPALTTDSLPGDTGIVKINKLEEDLIPVIVLKYDTTITSLLLEQETKRSDKNTKKGLLSKEWFLPFRDADNPEVLQKNLTRDNSKINGPSSVIIRPGLDSAKTSAVYVDLFSIFADNYFRVAFGTNITRTQFEDSVSTPKEIGFQKLSTGGGDIIMNLYRPVIFLDLSKDSSCRKFFVTAIEFNGFADIEGFNMDVYNPGIGCLTNASFNYRFITKASGENDVQGDFFRMGFNGRLQYNIVNEKYKGQNSIDGIFNNLVIGSVGMYIGVAMFNFQLSYNMYNKSDPFFNDKKWLLRIDLTPWQVK